MFPINRLLLFIALAITTNLQITNAAETETKHNYAVGLYESLLSAIEMDSENEVKQFVAFGADVNHRYKDGKTPLMLAASIGSIGSVRTLLKLDANPNLVSEENMTAMDYAKDNSNVYVIAVLEAKTNSQEKNIEQEKQLIAKIQFYLNKLGYKEVLVDGAYGEKTNAALNQFVFDHKQNFSPEISERQAEILFDAISKLDILKPIASKEDNVKLELSETIPGETDAGLTISRTEGLNISIRN